MIFNKHSNLVGKHAFLSASKYHWIGYDEDKLDRVFTASQAAQRGVELHALAHDLIRLGINLPDDGQTLSLYVNDGIEYQMSPEQTLFYSDNAFGTADSISFRRNMLRIHDLKNGITPGSPHQLEVYAALFCLEYDVRPFDIEMELRIYQSNNVDVFEPDPDAIFHIMDKIVYFDKRLNLLKEEGPQ